MLMIIIKYQRKKFSELYEQTQNKKKNLESAGYKVISIWESDFKKSLNNKYQ